MIDLIVMVVVIYFAYYFWITYHFDKSGKVKKHKKDKKEKTAVKQMPVEVQYFVFKYRIDLDKVNLRYFLQLFGLVVAIDLALVVLIIEKIPNFIWQVVAGIALIFVISLISFFLLGKYFKKKGLTKDV